MLVLASGCWTAPPPYYDYQLQNNYRYPNHPNQYYVQRHDSQKQYPVYATEEQKTTQQETFAPQDLKYSHVPAESPAHSVSTSSSPIVVTEPFHVSKKLESAIRSIAPLQPHGVNYQLHYQPESQYSKAYISYQTDQQQQLQHPHFAPQYYHEAPNLYSKPPSHSQVSKDIYVHVPPAEMEAVEHRQHYVQPPPRKHYRIVFIKAPTRNAAPVQPVQPVEEKTIIYVLTKKADPVELQTILEKQKPLKTNKPEVFFIKYKNNEEAQQAQETIKGNRTSNIFQIIVSLQFL